MFLAVLLAAGLSACQKPVKPRPATLEPTPQKSEASILYTSGGALFCTNLSGDSVSSFAPAGSTVWFPAVSPAQQQIAYWSQASGFYELWIYQQPSNRAQQLTFFNDKPNPTSQQNFNVHNAPAWSPDSKTIYFSYQGKIWKIESSGYNLETITPLGVYYSPSLSPDGKWLAYIKELSQTRNLYQRQLSSGDEWPLTKFPAAQSVGSPAWSPDGKQIAFTVSELDKVDIWLANADGSSLRQLTRDGFSNSPAWSPDGNKIAFASGRQDPYHWEVWVMNQDGGSQFSVTRNGGYAPAWISLQLPPQPTPAWTATAEPTLAAAFVPEPQEPLPATPTPGKSKPLPAPPVPKSATPKPTPKTEAIVKAKTPALKPTLAPTLAPTPIPTQPLPAANPMPGNAKHKTEKSSNHAKANAAPDKKLSQYEEYDEFEQYADKDKAILPTDTTAGKKDKNRIVFTPSIQFYFAKDLIKPGSMPEFKQLAEKLNEYPDATLVVEGFMRGPAFFKKIVPILKTLARARANSVLRNLIVNEKIRQINVNAISEGDPFPEPGEGEGKITLVVEVR